MSDQKYLIEKADSDIKYEGLRDLWCRVFGDEPGYVDHVYSVLGDEIQGYVICSEDNKVVSALTCYLCGSLSGTPVYVSYAVCTDPDYRGLGLAGRLTDYVRKVVTADSGEKLSFSDAPDACGLGGISLVSPAEESLNAFYGGLGYEESCLASVIRVTADADEDAEDYIMTEEDDFDAFEPAFNVKRADAAEYNMYREAFLADAAHVSLSQRMLDLISSECLDGEGLLVINGGDAVCAVSDCAGGKLTAAEFIVSPVLRSFSEEIDRELAGRITEYFGAEEFVSHMPALLSEDAGRVQSMAAGRRDEPVFYYGFPLD